MQKERFIYDNTLEASFFFYQMLVFFLKKILFLAIFALNQVGPNWGKCQSLSFTISSLLSNLFSLIKINPQRKLGKFNKIGAK